MMMPKTIVLKVVKKKSRRIIYAKKCLFPLWEKDVTEDFFSPQAEVFSRAVDF